MSDTHPTDMIQTRTSGLLEIHLPDLVGPPATIEVNDFSAATPGALMGVLATAQVLPPEDPQRPYVASVDGKELNLQQPFADQGVRPGSSVRFERRGLGAADGALEVRTPELTGAVHVPVLDMARATPAMLSAFLQHQGALPPEDPGRRYIFSAEGRQLNPNLPFAAQGVRPGAAIDIERESTGAQGGAPAPGGSA